MSLQALEASVNDIFTIVPGRAGLHGVDGLATLVSQMKRDGEDKDEQY